MPVIGIERQQGALAGIGRYSPDQACCAKGSCASSANQTPQKRAPRKSLLCCLIDCYWRAARLLQRAGECPNAGETLARILGQRAREHLLNLWRDVGTTLAYRATDDQVGLCRYLCIRAG